MTADLAPDTIMMLWNQEFSPRSCAVSEAPNPFDDYQLLSAALIPRLKPKAKIFDLLPYDGLHLTMLTIYVSIYVNRTNSGD
jgi:hypothetical protein